MPTSVVQIEQLPFSPLRKRILAFKIGLPLSEGVFPHDGGKLSKLH